jgi:hypothetical protein
VRARSAGPVVRVAVFTLLVLVAALAALAFSSTREQPGSVSESAALPAPPRPAFRIPQPERMSSPSGVTRSATVIRAVKVRADPSRTASIVTSLTVHTPAGTTNVVSVAGRATDTSGALWIAVRVSALPHALTGWVPRRALGAYSFVHTHLIVDLARRSAALMHDGRAIFHAQVGIGTSSSPTPTGEYYVRSKIWSLRSPFYGPLAFGTSARSRLLTDWPSGGFIGIHGTNRPDLLPGRVSHGCIRMRNEDILELGRLMPVGTPVTIR